MAWTLRNGTYINGSGTWAILPLGADGYLYQNNDPDRLEKGLLLSELFSNPVLPISSNVVLSGLFAARPLASAGQRIYYATDIFAAFASDGVTWYRLTEAVGVVSSFYGSGAITPGYLELIGGDVSRTTYADLFAILGVTYGAGDGSTTFGLPNMAGLFPRGLGSQNVNGRAKTSGVLGVAQEDALQGHFHEPLAPATTFLSLGAGVNYTGPNAGSAPTPTSTGAAITDGVNGAPRLADENRPSSLAVRWQIRAL